MLGGCTEGESHSKIAFQLRLKMNLEQLRVTSYFTPKRERIRSKRPVVKEKKADIVLKGTNNFRSVKLKHDKFECFPQHITSRVKDNNTHAYYK